MVMFVQRKTHIQIGETSSASMQHHILKDRANKQQRLFANVDLVSSHSLLQSGLSISSSKIMKDRFTRCCYSTTESTFNISLQ